MSQAGGGETANRPAAPLAGMLVVDMTRLLPGDFATWILADLGADVVKVEDTGGGDYMRWMPPMAGHSSAMYWALNRGKRAIRLDLKQAAGQEVLYRLAASADALVEGFRPGVMARLGLGHATLREINPALVYCAITGYGQDGPLEQRAGHDLLYNSLAGLQGVTGTADGEMALPGFQVADLGAGGMGGALAVVAALLRRERDPQRRGAFLDVSMFDGVSTFIAPQMARHLAGQRQPGPHAESTGPGVMQLNGRFPCYRVYRAGDGRWMALAALEPKFWEAFCTLVGRSDLVARQFDDTTEMLEEMRALFATRTRQQWEELASGADVMLEPVNDLGEAAAHPQSVARGLLVDVGADLPQPAPAVRFEEGYRADPRVAAQGEDTDVVLQQLGYSAEQLSRLRESGVI